jgi:cystathionine gamma-synthase
MDGISTTSIHADRDVSELPDVAPALRPSTTFLEGTGRRYRRSSHETTERFEAVIGALDGGFAVAYASGMAAAAAVLDHVGPTRIAIGDATYHGVRDLVARLAARTALEVVAPDALGPGDLWWIESPSNPYGVVTDLVDAGERARTVGVVTVCDATLATPVCCRPLALGIDIVMHASTKAIAGHSDAMGGVLVVSDESAAEDLRSERDLTGAIPGSLDVWLALRGVRTLGLRMERAVTSALAIGEVLSDAGLPTHYAGLDRDPSNPVAVAQMHGAGYVLAVDLGDAATAEAFIGSLRLFTNATSLGGVESLAERRALSDPAMPPGLVRMSIGIEDTDDLVADIESAVDAIRR